MPFEQVYVQTPNGARFGPVPMQDVVGWVKARNVHVDSMIVDVETGATRPLSDFPELVAAVPSDFTNVIMPRNAYAVSGYYLGVFSFIGIFICGIPGLLMGGAAIFLGWMGLKEGRENPLKKATGHCMTAIICGIISSLLSLGVIVLLFGSMLLKK